MQYFIYIPIFYASPPSSSVSTYDYDYHHDSVTFYPVCGMVRASFADDSYSFTKFHGPVSGEVTQYQVPGKNTVDYVAKPDYTYSYGVQDAKTGNSQIHKEQRDGESVRGEYRVLQADGMVRIVRYIADPINGFQADVSYAR